MYNKAYEKDITPGKRNFHWFIIIFGTFCGGVSFIMSVVEIIKAFAEVPTDTYAAESGGY